MKKEDYILVVRHPENGMLYSKPYGTNVKLARMTNEEAIFTRQDLVLSSVGGEAKHEARCRARERLNSLVFGRGYKFDKSKDYSWTFDKDYIRPSDDIISSVSNFVAATTWFCINRAWQQSLNPDIETVDFMLISEDFDIEKGFKLEHLSVPASSLRECADIIEAYKLLRALIDVSNCTSRLAVM